MVATALTRAAAVFGSSAAADIPTGNPRDEPRPQSTTPTTATHTMGTKMTTSRPTVARAADALSTGTRPKRSSAMTPPSLPTVIAATNTPKTRAPFALLTRCPSTIASASQSLAEPSANAMPRMMSPMSRVRESRQMLSRPRQVVEWSSSGTTAAWSSTVCSDLR